MLCMSCGMMIETVDNVDVPWTHPYLPFPRQEEEDGVMGNMFQLLHEVIRLPREYGD